MKLSNNIKVSVNKVQGRRISEEEIEKREKENELDFNDFLIVESSYRYYKVE